ncbi:uncharacterized protein [Primulina huaijiensis]|uniref:uncharacterized protein n=1 Tax=Primulina huaijiensis TaxID=1492673 RepID=UPI003CC764A2
MKSPEESLRAYIRRFNRVALDVPTCVTETKTTTFTQGLIEGEFFRSLTKNVPGDFDDLLSRAENYMNMEEAQKQKRETSTQDREVQECSRDLAPEHQLTRPEKNGFYTLHRVCYHNTEDCKTLKRDYVPPSIQRHSQSNKRLRVPPWTSRQPGPSARGDSRNALRSDLGRRREPEQERKKASPPAAGLIEMISRGSTNGDSDRATKSISRRYCMEVEGVRRNEAVISFGPEDLKGVNLPHNDALSVNVIFKDALVQMDSQSFQLETVETALFGFVGDVVYPEGETVLPLTLGSWDLKKTVMTTFTVVDSPSSYNIILGRPAMNEMRVVAYIYHQKIKFSVGSWVGEVQGDQPSSRKCYVETVRVDQSKARKEGKKARLDEGGGKIVKKEGGAFCS